MSKINTDRIGTRDGTLDIDVKSIMVRSDAMENLGDYEQGIELAHAHEFIVKGDSWYTAKTGQVPYVLTGVWEYDKERLEIYGAWDHSSLKNRDKEGSHSAGAIAYDHGSDFPDNSLGKELQTLKNNSSDYQIVDSFEQGATITERNQVLRVEADGRLYRWAGDLPKTVAAGSSPETTGGAQVGAWLEVSDLTLRQELANPDKGAAVVARGVVAVDSIADLLAMPAGQRKADMRYLVKGYHAGSDVGGGEFYWDGTIPSARHDGGYVISGSAPWEGLTLAEFLSWGEGGSSTEGGCFTRVISHRITPDEFGAKGDDQTDDKLPILSALLRSLSNTSYCFYLPPRRYFVGGKISVDCASRSINVTGERGKSTIRSNVVGDTLLEFIDTQTSQFSDIVLRGNGLSGAEGSGHGLAIYDSDPFGGTAFPQGCVIRGVRANGFRGMDTNRVSGAPLESCGIFVGGGKFMQVFDVNLYNCMHGLFFDDHGQIVVGGGTFVSCDRWGVAVLNNQSGVSIKDCDIVACGGVAGSIGSDYAGGGVYSIACSDGFSVDYVRVKNSKIGLCLNSHVVNIRNCSLEMEKVANGGDNVVIVRTGYATNIEGNAIYGNNDTDPLNTVYRGILCTVDVASRTRMLRVKGNVFRNNCVVEHFLSLEGTGFNRELTAHIDGNQFGHSSNYPLESVVNCCIKLRSITLRGSISGNNIASSGENALKKIEKVVDVDSIARFSVESLSISRNNHRLYLGGAIDEPIQPTSLSGSDTYTTSPYGLINIPTPLARQLTRFVVTAELSGTPVFVQINEKRSDNVVLRVYDHTGESYANSDIKLNWFATCQVDV